MLTGDALPVAQEIAQEVGLGSNIVNLTKYRQKKQSVDQKHSSSVSYHNLILCLLTPLLCIVPQY
jgi:magnesium-transporting ATPase (P-type)